MTQDAEPSRTDTVDPPQTFGGTLRRIGPGIIITGSIVGSGELIVTTKLGAEVGFTLLWLIILSCVIKVFAQIELGRYVISSGETALEAFDRVPGPRVVVSWAVWLWTLMAFCTIFQLSGILAGAAGVFTLTFENVLGSNSLWLFALGIAGLTAILLSSGRYRGVERTTTLLVFLFTAITIVAGICLQLTQDFAVRAADLIEGLSFKIPAGKDTEGIVTAFAAFGITGVGASELIYYPYWCLEKGYARFVGPRDDSAEWARRAEGWIRVLKVDAWLSMVVYTVGTVAFYFLGAAVLNRQNKVPGDDQMLETLSQMYTSTFGESVGIWVFLVGAFAVLFSTYFVATASNTRAFSDAFQVFKLVRYRDDVHRLKMVRILCVAVPLTCFLIQVGIPKMVTLVMIGGLAQACMLPVIAFAVLYLRYRRMDKRIMERRFRTEFLLWISALCMTAVGVFIAQDKIRKQFDAPSASETPVEQPAEEK